MSTTLPRHSGEGFLIGPRLCCISMSFSPAEEVGKRGAAPVASTGVFVPFLQAKACALTGAVVGVEILMRPADHLVSAEAFYTRLATLPKEERTPLELAVLAATATLANVTQGMPVSINVSPVVLLSPEGLATAESILAAFSPAQVTIELLERDVVDVLALSVVVERLVAQGARIALDDFGHAHSAVGLLASLPVVHEVKLDRSLVHSPRARSILPSVIGLARTLGAQATAEFVDSEERLQLVRECGVDYVQGNHIASATPAGVPLLLRW